MYNIIIWEDDAYVRPRPVCVAAVAAALMVRNKTGTQTVYDKNNINIIILCAYDVCFIVV